MSKPLIKSRLLLGNKHLGALFYDKKGDGRGYLKLSFKNKIAGFVKGSDVPTTMPASLKLEEPVKIELSYKFNDNLFSVKKIIDGRKPAYEFYKVSVPPQTCLFYLRIKDWHLLDDASHSPNPLVLNLSGNCNSIAVIFSFLDKNERPLSPPEYSDTLMGCIDLPEKKLKRLCIGVAPDPNNNESNNIVIMLPLLAK